LAGVGAAFAFLGVADGAGVALVVSLPLLVAAGLDAGVGDAFAFLCFFGVAEAAGLAAGDGDALALCFFGVAEGDGDGEAAGSGLGLGEAMSCALTSGAAMNVVAMRIGRK